MLELRRRPLAAQLPQQGGRLPGPAGGANDDAAARAHDARVHGVVVGELVVVEEVRVVEGKVRAGLARRAGAGRGDQPPGRGRPRDGAGGEWAGRPGCRVPRISLAPVRPSEEDEFNIRCSKPFNNNKRYKASFYLRFENYLNQRLKCYLMIREKKEPISQSKRKTQKNNEEDDYKTLYKTTSHKPHNLFSARIKKKTFDVLFSVIDNWVKLICDLGLRKKKGWNQGSVATMLQWFFITSLLLKENGQSKLKENKKAETRENRNHSKTISMVIKWIPCFKSYLLLKENGQSNLKREQNKNERKLIPFKENINGHKMDSMRAIDNDIVHYE